MTFILSQYFCQFYFFTLNVCVISGRYEPDTGLGTGAIVGIILSCCSALLAICGGICKAASRSGGEERGATVSYKAAESS